MKKHKYPFSVKKLRSMCKAICSFDSQYLIFVETVYSSAIQYNYSTYPTGFSSHWYDVISSGKKNKTERYVDILKQVQDRMEEGGFYGSMFSEVPKFCCFSELAINPALRGL